MAEGPKTTEFWLAAVVIAVVVLGPALGLQIDKDEVFNLLTVFGIYTGSRTAVKVTAKKEDPPKEKPNEE